jgi:hypothetical protein
MHYAQRTTTFRAEGARGLVTCLMLTALTTTLRAQAMPMLPAIIPDSCPVECCRLGDWPTGRSPVSVFAVPGQSTKRIATVPARAVIHVDSTVEVVRRFGIAVVDKPVRAYPSSVYDSTMLAPGDTVYLMLYRLEDNFTAVVRGKQLTIEAFWGQDRPGMLRPLNTPRFGRVIRGLQSEWWVHVRHASGTAGWINVDKSSVGVPDGCSPN